MQIWFECVYTLVAVAFFNPRQLHNNTAILEQNDEIINAMKELEKPLTLDQPSQQQQEPSQENLELSLEQKDQPQESQAVQDTDLENSLHICDALSLIYLIFYIIKTLFWNSKRFGTHDYSCDDEDICTAGNISTKTLLLDKVSRETFYERCVRIPGYDNCKVREFVKGFSDDILEALRSVCETEADMEVKDCIGVGSMYELWRAVKPLICDVIVPLSPPKPYNFKSQLWFSLSNDIPANMLCCGRIKVEKGSKNGSRCLCATTDVGEDVLCLLHTKPEKPSISDSHLLCSNNTLYLAKDKVMRWFKISMKKAWERISHKYEFELTFHHLDSKGSLKVRFKSGKTIVFNMIPVVQYEDTKAYFVPQFPANGLNSSNIYWSLSFAVYEKHLLDYFAKSLPDNSCHIRCLQMGAFLHKKQTSLTGKSDLTNYHFKTALLHLLLSKKSSEWGSEHLKHRLHDMLDFLAKGLKEKKLCHILLGNTQVPKDIGLPIIFSKSEPTCV